MALAAHPRDLAVRVAARVFSLPLAGALTGLAFGLASVRCVELLLSQVRSAELPLRVTTSLAIQGAAALAASAAVIHAVKIDMRRCYGRDGAGLRIIPCIVGLP